MNPPDRTTDQAREAERRERMREVEAAVKAVDTGSVTIHIAGRQIRHVDVTTRRKIAGR